MPRRIATYNMYGLSFVSSSKFKGGTLLSVKTPEYWLWMALPIQSRLIHAFVFRCISLPRSSNAQEYLSFSAWNVRGKCMWIHTLGKTYVHAWSIACSKCWLSGNLTDWLTLYVWYVVLHEDTRWRTYTRALVDWHGEFMFWFRWALRYANDTPLILITPLIACKGLARVSFMYARRPCDKLFFGCVEQLWCVKFMHACV
jgi:hypothetical protein